MIAAAATIGRGESNEIVIQNDLVSKNHARISYDDEAGHYFVEDLQSLNGTSLDGVRISGKNRLDRLHVITFAKSIEFIFQDLSATADGDLPEERDVAVGEVAAAPHDKPSDGIPESLRETIYSPQEPQPSATGETVAIEPATPKSVPAKDLQPPPSGTPQGVDRRGGQALSLEIFGPTGASLKAPLSDGENVVGRSEDADIQVKSADMSRRHATITVGPDAVTIRDEGSLNRTFLRGEEVVGETEVPIGVELMFGKVKARLVTGD